MSIVAGSYERFIWGYKLKTPSDSKSTTLTPTLIPQFSYAAHLSPITTVTVSSTVAASASSDDSVKLYDLTTSTELGSVLLHSSSATSLAFFSPSSTSFPRNLFAGSHDGSFHIFDIDPFVLLKSSKVHKKAVNDIAVHSSGKVALTVGRDSCLGMLNLAKGKRTFRCKLEKEAQIVEYCGTRASQSFFMCCGDQISVHDSEDAKILANFQAPKPILSATPAQNGLIFTGGEDRGITAWDVNSGKVAYSIENAHKSRVKGIVVLTRDGTSCAAENPFLVASASSDGVIRVWDIRGTSKGQSMPISEADTKSRLTCLAGSAIKPSKQTQVAKDAPENKSTVIEDGPVEVEDA